MTRQRERIDARLRLISLKQNTDGGHSWLIVPVPLLLELAPELVGIISAFSYVSMSHVYLETHRDAPMFHQALDARGDVRVRVRNNEVGRSRIRDQGVYFPCLVRDWAKNPIIGPPGSPIEYLGHSSRAHLGRIQVKVDGRIEVWTNATLSCRVRGACDATWMASEWKHSCYC